MKKRPDTMFTMNPYLFMLLSVGIVWLRSSFGKITSGKFAETLGQTLLKFASNNPYPWYKSYLENFAIPNARVMGMVIMWGELMCALAIIGASLYLLFKPDGVKAAEIVLLAGLAVGMILNINFWLASGWMSPSTESINMLMFLIECIGFVYGIKKIIS